MAYNNNSIYVSGSTTSYTKPPRFACLTTGIINNSSTGTFTFENSSSDFGRFYPSRLTFHYNTADGTATSDARFNLGHSSSPNAFITSGSLTLDGGSGVRTNQVEHYNTFNAGAAAPAGTNLTVAITSLGSCRVTGSFVLQGFFLEY